MSLFDLAAFYRFLSEASDEELAEKSALLSAFIDQSKVRKTRLKAEEYLLKLEDARLDRIVKK